MVSFDNKINNKIEDKNNENEDNSLYNNLKIYDEQNNIYINLIYDISYLNYKKKIFSQMNYDYNLILDIFDENICDILINIYILKKKNKIQNKYFVIIEHLFTYVKKLNEITYLDQENFLIIILDFYKINILSLWIGSFFDKFLFKELIDYKTLINKITNVFDNLSKKILIFYIFEELAKIDDEKLIIKKIIYLTQKISLDLFMFYDSTKIFNEIIKCLTYLNEIISDNNDIIIFLNNYYPNLIITNNKLLETFKKYKKHFIEEYDKNISNHIDIYSNEIELQVKFKVKKSEIIDNFLKNLIYIDNI